MSFEKVIRVETARSDRRHSGILALGAEKGSTFTPAYEDELHITWEDNAILLPLDGLAQALVQHFDRKGWCVTIAQMEEQEKEKAGITLSLLHGQWMELLEYLAQEPDPEASVRIIAWDFQQPVLRQRGTLPTKARGGV